MAKALIRVVLIGVVLVAGAFFVFGYWTGGSWSGPVRAANAPEARAIDTSVARERGAEVGEKAAKAAAVVNKSIEEGALTTKITAKMVLDDLVKARTIDVTTNGTTVTLAGTVHSDQERARAIELARDTAGVTAVNDRLAIKLP